LVVILEEHSKKYYKKKRIIDKYNSTSQFYDSRYKIIQEQKYEIILQKYSANNKRILDMGCGTGLFYEYINNSMFDNGTLLYKYVGLDISWNMLLEIKSKILRSSLIRQFPTIIQSDIESLPLRDDTFHSIFTLTSFQNLPELQKGIKESLRVSKNEADFKLSILRKNLVIKSLLDILKSKIKDLELIELEKLEDIIISGKILKDKDF